MQGRNAVLKRNLRISRFALPRAHLTIIERAGMRRVKRQAPLFGTKGLFKTMQF